jgi:hypothetical protein
MGIALNIEYLEPLTPVSLLHVLCHKLLVLCCDLAALLLGQCAWHARNAQMASQVNQTHQCLLFHAGC